MTQWELQFEDYPGQSPALRWARVPWDSELFELAVVELQTLDHSPTLLATHLPGLLERLRSEQVGLAYVRLPVGEVDPLRVFTEHGFYLVEVGLELALELKQLRRPWGDRPTGMRVRVAEVKDLAVLREIACTGLSATRYHIDPAIPRDKANLRIENWVERGLKDGDPTWFYESESSGEPIGFFQYRRWPDQVAYMSLASVREKYQGMGLGMIMVENALAACREEGQLTAVAKTSLNNQDAVYMCLALGFQIRQSSYTLHWMPDV
jgi:ribosomal protein S18 acetylase RimI-like enzyme